MSSEPTESDRKKVTPSPPNVWAAIVKDLEEYDENNAKRGKEDVDTLLVFAGLFSAVLASFLVAVYPSLQPSPMDMMNYTLERIANQTASYNFTDGRLVTTNLASPLPPFQASAEDIRVNVLWFASLTISLITSSFGVLVKQWLDDSRAVDIPEPQARLRLRHHRKPQIEAWLVYEIVAFLPLLLHLSLGLFFIGLCYFTAAINARIGYTTLPLVLGWAVCLFFMVTLPIFFPRCPYRISLFKPMIARLQRTLSHFANWLHHVSSWPQVQVLQEGSSNFQARRVTQEARLLGSIRTRSMRLRACIRRAFLSLLAKVCLITLSLRDIPDEDKVAKDSAADLQILVAIDAMWAHDEFLHLVVMEELPRIRPNTGDAFCFAMEVLAHRAPTVVLSECLIPEWPFRDPFPFDLVRAQAKESISNILHGYVVLHRVPYDRNAVPIPLRQRDALPDKVQRRVLCTLTMLISGVSNSSEVKLPPNVIDFLHFYLDSVDGPAVCRDILSLMVWHCADAESCWDTTARLITSLAKLMAPLHLRWKDAVSCLHSILCFKIADPDPWDRLNPVRAHLTWNYPDDGVGVWEDWSIPDDAPYTLKAAAVKYLFILLSAGFKRVEDWKEFSPEAHADQETPEVLCCALRHFMKYDAWDNFRVASTVLQAFVDFLSTPKSKELMGIMAETLAATDFADVQSSSSASKSDDLYLRWSARTCHAIRREYHFKPSNTTTEQSFPIFSSIVNQKFGLPTADLPNPDINLHQCLSLCHIAIFLYVTIYAQPDMPELGRKLFSSIADTLKSKTEGCGAEIFNDKVARQLAFDCLCIMDYEQDYKGGYNTWLAVFSQSRKTSFPDTLVEVLGRFIPDNTLRADWLFRLQELKERPHSVQPPVDTPPDQQTSELEGRSTEQDENPAVAVVDELPDSTTPTYPSIVQDLPMAGPSMGVDGGLEGEGRSESGGRPEGAINERESMEGHEPQNEPEASRSGGEGEEGSPDN